MAPATPVPLRSVPTPADTITPAPRWATLDQAAQHVGGVTARTIREWIREGLIPGYRFGARFIRVNLNDLDAMAARMQSATEWDGDAA